MLLLAGGLISLSALPMILLYVVIFILFLAILYWILRVLPPTAAYARTYRASCGGDSLADFLD